MPALYHVPLALVAEPIEPHAVVRRDDAGYLIDATRHPEFAIGMLAEMGVDVSRVTGSRVLTGEQSNTSIVFDEDGEPTIILKLFRTLHHGENPDVTVQRVLSNAGSPYVPRFLGSLDAEWPDVGRESGDRARHPGLRAGIPPRRAGRVGGRTRGRAGRAGFHRRPHEISEPPSPECTALSARRWRRRMPDPTR